MSSTQGRALSAIISLCLAGCRPSYAVNVRVPVDVTASVSVAGRWTSSWGEPTNIHGAVLTLQQHGERVWGGYVSEGAPDGNLEGRLVGNTLQGSWAEVGGEGGGFRFVFEPNGTRFEGTWGLGAYDDNGGVWLGTRE